MLWQSKLPPIWLSLMSAPPRLFWKVRLAPTVIGAVHPAAPCEDSGPICQYESNQPSWMMTLPPMELSQRRLGPLEVWSAIRLPPTVPQFSPMECAWMPIRFPRMCAWKAKRIPGTVALPVTVVPIKTQTSPAETSTVPPAGSAQWKVLDPAGEVGGVCGRGDQRQVVNALADGDVKLMSVHQAGERATGPLPLCRLDQQVRVPREQDAPERGGAVQKLCVGESTGAVLAIRTSMSRSRRPSVMARGT